MTTRQPVLLPARIVRGDRPSASIRRVRPTPCRSCRASPIKRIVGPPGRDAHAALARGLQRNSPTACRAPPGVRASTPPAKFPASRSAPARLFPHRLGLAAHNREHRASSLQIRVPVRRAHRPGLTTIRLDGEARQDRQGVGRYPAVIEARGRFPRRSRPLSNDGRAWFVMDSTLTATSVLDGRFVGPSVLEGCHKIGGDPRRSRTSTAAAVAGHHPAPSASVVAVIICHEEPTPSRAHGHGAPKNAAMPGERHRNRQLRRVFCAIRRFERNPTKSSPPQRAKRPAAGATARRATGAEYERGPARTAPQGFR